MELEQLLKLIQTVSDSKLTEFKYETEAVCIKMGKEKEVKVIAAGRFRQHLQKQQQ